MPSDEKLIDSIGGYKYGFSDPEVHVFKSRKGLDKEIVEQISQMKGEPEWMLKYRLKALEHFEKRPTPTWGPDLSTLDLDDIYYYVKPIEQEESSWDDIPDSIKNTFDKLGIPEAEQKFLAGVGAQYESEMIYHSIHEQLAEQGVIFKSIENGLREHPELFREYFGTVIPYSDNKYAALNSAVWSGGSFVYIPPGLKVDLPLQAYFRLNVANIGQFERSIIIADEGSQVHYVEGCTAPTYTTDSVHSGVIEIIVKKDARVRYTTIQNWSNNVYNLVTQRSRVEENGTMEWVDANLGSKVTMKYPSCMLMGKGAHGEILSIAFSGKGQHPAVKSFTWHQIQPARSFLNRSVKMEEELPTGDYCGLIEVTRMSNPMWYVTRCSWTRTPDLIPILILRLTNKMSQLGTKLPFLK